MTLGRKPPLEAQASAAAFRLGAEALGAASKQTPLIKVVPEGQAALWPPTVLALPAEAAEVALGTVPRALRLMSSPERELGATLLPLIALLAILPVVTAFAFSCLEPTVFLPRAAY